MREKGDWEKRRKVKLQLGCDIREKKNKQILKIQSEFSLNVNVYGKF